MSQVHFFRNLLPTFLLIWLSSFSSFSQNHLFVKGQVMDMQTKEPISNVMVSLDGTLYDGVTRQDGWFYIPGIPAGNFMLVLEAPGYVTKKYPIVIERTNGLNLGLLSLERDITQEFTNNIISLTENELADDESGAEITSGFLQSVKDIFLSRAAFDFGQAFFKVRGYDSKEGTVLLNGLPMNKTFNGRPQWNNWGGLNDVTRNQDFTMGLSASHHTFGGLLGSTNILLRPSKYRKGLRVSASASNRSYAGRLMATYNSAMQNNGLAYSISASRRWAKEGYINGSLYDAYSLFTALEFALSKNHSINAVAMFAPNRKGGSAPITKEVFDLAGRQYNPYWGKQEGEMRNSRVREIEEPIFLLTHFLETEKFRLTSSAAYQFGNYARGRLGYYNAPNPDPSYYRYLPSFYVNNPSGANFENANLAKEGFLNDPQLNWGLLYNANLNPIAKGKSAYVLYDDSTDDGQTTLSSVANINFSPNFRLDAGISYQNLKSDNFAIVKDLLGGAFHEDIDPFTNTRNDLQSNPLKSEKDRFGYNYLIDASIVNAFSQTQFVYKNWDAFLSANISKTSYQREGLFLNERFQNNSLGKSEAVEFSNYGIKAGATYKFTGRHILSINSGYFTKAPTLQNTFVNPRENNDVVKDIVPETVIAADASYILRLPNLNAKLTSYYTKFEDVTEVNYFFVEGGVGTDFVQEAATGIDKQHLGGELGVAYQASPTVKLTAVAAYGKFTYADDANVTINFDTAGREEDIINPEGFLDLGKASIKDYKVAAGPQKAFAFGVEYRDPEYWWVSTTANFLGDNYIDIATITRTQSFYIDPETGENFPNATDEAVAKLLKQEKLEDFYLLNLVGGKSWLIDGKYISLFASINNVFDTNYRTGGFEQSRNGNFGQLSEDNARGMPSFGPKYWYGFGRTYFLNLAISF